MIQIATMTVRRHHYAEPRSHSSLIAFVLGIPVRPAQLDTLFPIRLLGLSDFVVALQTTTVALQTREFARLSTCDTEAFEPVPILRGDLFNLSGEVDRLACTAWASAEMWAVFAKVGEAIDRQRFGRGRMYIWWVSFLRKPISVF